MRILMSPWLRLFLFVLLGLLLLDPARLLLGVEPLGEAKATVIAVEPVQSQGRGPGGLLLRYRDQDHIFTYEVEGEQHTARIRRPDESYAVGEVVVVTYFERDPAKILRVDGQLINFPFVRLIAIKLVVILLLGLSIQAYRMNRKKAGQARG